MVRLSRATRVVAASAFALSVLAAPAAADTFPGNYDAALADSSLHTFCLTSTFTTDPSIATYAMDVLDSTTDMWDSHYSSCDNSLDVWWWEWDLPGSLRGQRTCYAYNSAGRCDSSDIDIDLAQLDIGSDDWYDRRKTSVHELGHSVGANHDSESAMISGEIPSTALQWRRYSAHDIGHINAAY
jgi:hypothetical protein